MLDSRTRNRLRNMVGDYTVEMDEDGRCVAQQVLDLSENPDLWEIKRLIDYTKSRSSVAPEWVDLFGMLNRLANSVKSD